MAASINCWKCLSRPSSAVIQLSSRVARVAASAPFSSTSTNLALPAPTRKAASTTKGVKTNLKINKKPRPKESRKPPATGERKALRKRIVLSNTNALEVAGMEDLSPEMVDAIAKATAEGEAGSELVGKVVGLPGATVDSLRAIEAFKRTQGWGLFRRPGTLIRKETVALTKALLAAQKEKSTLTLMLDGARGTGKSMMLLQAQASAFAKSWIVLHIPQADYLSNGVTDYAPIPGSDLWAQPTYTAEWMAKIGKANHEILKTLKMNKTHNLPVPIEKDITLARFCELGSRDPDIAWYFFQAFWTELNLPGRPPVLLTLDGMSYIMGMSNYRDTNNNLIHCHNFALVKHFVDHISGTSKLANGGAIIGSTSRSHNPISRSMDLAIHQALQRQAKQEITQKDPFEQKYDERATKALQNASAMMIGGLTKKESRGLMEYWAASGVLRQRVDEKTVAERWALAGHGVASEIQRGALKMRI
ncbi:hypothetical protein HYFRA_00006945 [Hymenoscyphus fraxineus]|uniref:Small ribosomal subunit protein mS29 n=1 Tax=Hymenoscyphus fraxineus TaxID=746836 RepID=A0A9N9PFI5_9HELO|nr:hypothetical protein HYFRA_00006945 [Hymenoscyphus fraxineus]